MPNYNILLNVMKQAGMNANEANRPVNVCFGKVVNLSPIKISIDQKLTLGSMQLVLTQSVADTLELDDVVVIIRVQGGQKYVVIDKVVNA